MKLKELHEAVEKSIADMDIEFEYNGDLVCTGRGVTSLEG
jgi:hypothetical protein